MPMKYYHFVISTSKKQEDLQDYHPLGVHNDFGQNASKRFVVLRYKVDILQ